MFTLHQTAADTLLAIHNQLGLPQNYLVMDLETSGFSRDHDFIIDVGWVVVRDSKPVHSTGLLLDWSQAPVNHSAVQARLAKQASDYAAQERPHYYPWERLCQEGDHPFQVIHTAATIIYEHLQAGYPIVGHGLWMFDKPFFNRHTDRYLQGYELPWQVNSVVDTGLIERALQSSCVPTADDSWAGWNDKVKHTSSRTKWSMEKHCVPKYQLVERYQANMQLMHTAEFDCFLIYYLLDTYRQLVEILNGQREIFDPPFQGSQRDVGNNAGPAGLR